MRSSGRILILVLLVAAGHVVAAEQRDNKRVGKAASPFLLMAPSARLTALGGDQVAAHGDSAVFFSNPAGIATLQIPELWFTHNQSLIDSEVESIGFAAPLKNQTIGFSAQYFNRGTEERIGIDSSNHPVTGLGDFRFSTTLFHAVWARDLNDRWSIGLTGKGWQDSLDGKTTTGFAGDTGVLARNLVPSLDVGVSVRNLGPNVNGYELPRNAALGAAYHLKKAAIFSEVAFSGTQKTALHTGVEHTNENFWLRAGYQNVTTDVADSLSQFAFGGGLRIKGWKVDYAWKPMGNLGDQHRISLTMGFGMTPAERDRAAKELDRAMEKRIADHSRQSLEFGRQVLRRGQWEKAVEHFERALAWDPQNQEAAKALQVAKEKKTFAEAQRLVHAGQALSRQNRWLEAASSWKQALNLVPSFQEANDGLKLAKKKMSRPSPQNISIDVNEAAINEGLHHFLAGNHDKALEIWNGLLSSSPDNARIREYVDKAEKMKLQQEVAALKASQGKRGDHVEAMIQQAYTLFRLGQTDKAITTWERALALDPSNVEAKSALKEARAKKQLLKGQNIQIANSRVEELNSEAMDAYVRGELDKSALLLRRALGMDPRNGRVRNNLIRVESELASQNIVEEK